MFSIGNEKSIDFSEESEIRLLNVKLKFFPVVSKDNSQNRIKNCRSRSNF